MYVVNRRTNPNPQEPHCSHWTLDITLERHEIDYINGGPPEGWTERPLKKFVYVDDYNVVEQLRQRDAIHHITQYGHSTDIHATKTEEIFNLLQANASSIGMKVNPDKTQMLCISATQTKCKANLTSETGERIASTDSLKLLGFHFNTSAGPNAHIQKLKSKFNSRLWSLRYLKKSGMELSDLRKAYVCFLRPLLEYAVPAFHSMMTGEQSDLLESLQARALKIIYGFQLSYSTCLLYTSPSPRDGLLSRMPSSA